MMKKRKEAYGIIVCAFFTILLYVICLGKYLELYETSTIFSYVRAIFLCIIAGFLLSRCVNCFLQKGQETERALYLCIVCLLFEWAWDRFPGAGDREDLVFAVMTVLPLLISLLSAVCVDCWKNNKDQIIKTGVLLILTGFAVLVLYFRPAVYGWEKGNTYDWITFEAWIILWIVQAVAAPLYLFKEEKNQEDKKKRRQIGWIVFCVLFMWAAMGGLTIYLDTWRKILYQIWPVFVFLVLRFTGELQKRYRIPGFLRCFAYFALIFFAMWFQGRFMEPVTEYINHRWEIDVTVYLVLIADIVFFMEMFREYKDGKAEKPENPVVFTGIMVIANTLFFVFIREICYSMRALEFFKAESDYQLYDAWLQHPLIMMNQTVGGWTVALLLVLFCMMVFFMYRLCCGNTERDILGRYICLAWMLRGIFAVLSNLFCIQSSVILFPLIGGNFSIFGAADTAVLAMFLLFIFFDRCPKNFTSLLDIDT